MLTDDQIDYLLQIKKSASPIGENTARVMLDALRWSAEDIDRGIAFLNRAPETESKLAEKPQVVIEEAPVSKPETIKKQVSIKQDPFPVGSTYTKILKQKEEVRGNNHSIAGMITGLVLLIVCILLYTYFF